MLERLRSWLLFSKLRLFRVQGGKDVPRRKDFVFKPVLEISHELCRSQRSTVNISIL